jgi:hypothetical protein
VEARPPSAGYRLNKFLKRNKGPVLAASLVLFAPEDMKKWRAEQAKYAQVGPMQREKK